MNAKRLPGRSDRRLSGGAAVRMLEYGTLFLEMMYQPVGWPMPVLITNTIQIPTNGVRLHAEACGPASGPLVLMLHGFPETWAGWANQIAPLARSGFFVVAPDQRGYSISEKPAAVDQYSVENLARDVIGILDHFQREKATIIGHDWGGVVAWQVGMQYPERVSRLAVLNAPHPAAFIRALLNPGTGQIARSWYIYAFQIPGWAEFTLRLSGYAAFKRAMRAINSPYTFPKAYLDRLVEAWRQPGALTGMINWYRAAVRHTLRLGEKGYRRASEVRVSVPTLILWGERDAALVPSLAASSLEWCDNGRLVRFPEATHWLHHDEHERVTAYLLDLLLE